MKSNLLKKAWEDERFSYMGLEFAIDEAEQIIASKPRAPQMAPKNFIENFVGRVEDDMPSEDGKVKYNLLGTNTDPAHVLKADPDKPGIIATVAFKPDKKHPNPMVNYILIDGNHRAKRALQMGREGYACYVLTPEETWAVMAPYSFPPVLKGYVNPLPPSMRSKKKQPVKTSSLDESDYEHGYCHMFALALHNVLGYKLGGVWDGGHLVHAYAVRPNGTLVDFTGTISLQDAMYDHGDVVDPEEIEVSPEWIKKMSTPKEFGAFSPADLKQAEDFIRANIEMYSVKPKVGKVWAADNIRYNFIMDAIQHSDADDDCDKPTIRDLQYADQQTIVSVCGDEVHFFELWTEDCLEGLRSKSPNTNLSDEQLIDQFLIKRFPAIARKAGLKMHSWDTEEITLEGEDDWDEDEAYVTTVVMKKAWGSSVVRHT